MRRVMPADAGTGLLVIVMVLGLLLAGCTQVIEATSTTSSDATATTTIPTTTTTTSVTTTSTTVMETTTTSSRDLAPAGALLVFGDWGSGTLPQGAVAGAMARYAEQHRVAAILTTGDNFYSDNAEFLLEPLDWALRESIPFWITWGNHDVETASRIETVEEAFGSPPRWTLHEWRDVDVIILDSNQMNSKEQIDFLEQALEESQNPAIVVFHHPPLTCGAYRDNQGALDSWVPLFDDDVLLVLGGHDHNYQRFEHDGVTYIVSGGGGRRLYELTDCSADHPQRIAGEAIHHFLTLTQEDDQIVVEVIGVTGETIDEFTVPLS